jgi:hypothetical protein
MYRRAAPRAAGVAQQVLGLLTMSALLSEIAEPPAIVRVG